MKTKVAVPTMMQADTPCGQKNVIARAAKIKGA
jgi:hypothetical protein